MEAATPSTSTQLENGKQGRKSSRARQTTWAMKQFLKSRWGSEESEDSSNGSGGGPAKRRRGKRKKLVKRMPKLAPNGIRKQMMKVVKKGVYNDKRGTPLPALFRPNQSKEGAKQAVVKGKEVYTHVFNLGGNPTLYECKFCKRRFTSWIRVRLHKACATGKFRFSCVCCGSKWHSKSEYNRHIMRKHMHPKNVSCGECGDKFKCDFDLADHVRREHGRRGEPVSEAGNGESSSKKVVAAAAAADADVEEELEAKKDLIEEKKADVEEKLEAKEDLIEKKEADLVSNVNGDASVKVKKRTAGVGIKRVGQKGITKKTAVQRLYPIISGLTKAARDRRLRRNLVTSRPYSCTHKGCTNTYIDRRHLLRHQLIHSKVPHFQCKLCDSAYKWKTTLDKHISREHPDPLFKPVLRQRKPKISSEFTSPQTVTQLSSNDCPQLEKQDLRTPAPDNDLSSDEVDIVGLDDDAEEITTDEIDFTGLEPDDESETEKEPSEVEDESVVFDHSCDVVEQLPDPEEEEETGADKNEVEVKVNRRTKEEMENEWMAEFVSLFSQQALTEMRRILSNEMPPYPY